MIHTGTEHQANNRLSVIIRIKYTSGANNLLPAQTRLKTCQVQENVTRGEK